MLCCMLARAKQKKKWRQQKSSASKKAARRFYLAKREQESRKKKTTKLKRWREKINWIRRQSEIYRYSTASDNLIIRLAHACRSNLLAFFFSYFVRTFVRLHSNDNLHTHFNSITVLLAHSPFQWKLQFRPINISISK